MTSRLVVNSIRHTGSSGDAVTLASDGTCTANITNNLSNRNLIINGAMLVAQRGTSFSSNNAAHYMLDRFRSEADNDGAFTVSQSTTAPDGFSKSLKVDITSTDTSLSASQYQQITYKVEAQDLQHLAYGTSAAKTITLSFYVRSNKTGNYNFVYEQPDNGNRLASYQYTINSANTWERKVITTTGDTSGVINDDNGVGLNMKWGLAYGSTYSSGSVTNGWAAQNNANFGAGQDVNILDSTSNEWYITGVQLEVSDHATDFEHLSYGNTLPKCQRYFWKFGGVDTGWIFNGIMANSSNARMLAKFPVPMRSSPTITFNDLVVDAEVSGSVEAISSVANTYFDPMYGGRLSLNCSSSSVGTGASVMLYPNSTSGYLQGDSEL